MYCNDGILEIIHEKHKAEVPIAGLSAGSKIMNDTVFLKHSGKTEPGLALVQNMQIFPHFEEDAFAYEAIRYCRKNVGRRAYGLENSTFLNVMNDGTVKNTD